MCEYCKKEKFESEYKNELYLSFPLKDDYTEKFIDPYDENNPVQYIRKNDKKYYLITELNNEDGDVLSTEINYCPMCRKKAR